MNTNTLDTAASDEQLVERHLTGDPAAFREIVTRHQATVCAVAFSACGDVTRSEDVAQETFVAVWRQLGGLRERSKFRAWLVGIARNLARNHTRRALRGGQLSRDVVMAETATDAPDPREQTTNADRLAQMWRELEGIPALYREPMVLFYREQHSHESVAAALDVSQEVVRQRLARGRAMLTERMTALVEEALAESAPKPALVERVLGAIPILVGPGLSALDAARFAEGAPTKLAMVAGVAGSLAGKGGVAGKALFAVGLVPAVFFGWMDFLKFRAAYETASPGPRRRHVLETALRPLVLGAVFVGLLSDFGWFYGSGGVVAGLGLFLVALVASRRRLARNDAAADATGIPPGAAVGKVRFEYRSPKTFFGLSLVHIHVGGTENEMRRTARGWIAVTDGIAAGGLFAAGGQLAVAPVSIGPVAIGAVDFGFVSIGLAALGGVAAGLYAYGAAAFAWIAAKGGVFAKAGEYALAETAIAPHANDATARAFFENRWFFRAAEGACAMAVETLIWFWVAPLLLIVGYFFLIRNRTA